MNELNSRPSSTYTYDSNGNTTSKTDSTGTTNYTWDFENRLITVTLPGSGGAVYFKYDPFGRRIYKQSPTATSIFAYDGDNLVETVTASGGVVARYTQGLNIDEPLAELRGATTDYYEADGLGSITSLTDTTGAPAATYTYDSFGNTVASIGTLRNYFRYTGREFDTETSLYYYRARYYDPQAGRFLSEDPLAFGAGVNFYRYADNNPVFWRDASGLFPSGPAAVMVPSLLLPGRRKLEGNLDPLCRKGRNLAVDAANLLESVVTREGEIQFYANHPDPNMRALAGDPGHLARIENELETLERCRDNDPKCDRKPDEKPFPFPVPLAWEPDPNAKRVPVGATSTGAGAVVTILVIGLLILAF